MKVKFVEHDSCFAVELVAEDMPEAAALVRFGGNRTKIRSACVFANKDGTFSASIAFGKHTRAGADVQKRK
jgi:hypothetical protein